MIGKTDKEILIGLDKREAMLLLNALAHLGKHSRTQSLNDDETEDYRERWTDYVSQVLDLHKGLTKQIKQHEEDYKEEEAH